MLGRGGLDPGDCIGAVGDPAEPEQSFVPCRRGAPFALAQPDKLRQPSAGHCGSAPARPLRAVEPDRTPVPRTPPGRAESYGSSGADGNPGNPLSNPWRTTPPLSRRDPRERSPGGRVARRGGRAGARELRVLQAPQYWDSAWRQLPGRNPSRRLAGRCRFADAMSAAERRPCRQCCRIKLGLIRGSCRTLGSPASRLEPAVRSGVARASAVPGGLADGGYRDPPRRTRNGLGSADSKARRGILQEPLSCT